eukprot:COSAG05_NODE_3774_length_1843_cov_2.593463_2_plen_280_part_01
MVTRSILLQIDMLYAGIADGRFLGYFSHTEYTERATGSSLPDSVVWAPANLTSVNEYCAGNETCVGNKANMHTVATSCPEVANATRSGECRHPYRDDALDAATIANDSACTAAGNYWYLPFCTDGGCCDTSINPTYSTSAESNGAPEALSYWRAYDHRIRPWYKQALQLLAEQGVTSSWSSIYTFIGNSQEDMLGMTATQTVANSSNPGKADAVFAIDFSLDLLSEVLNATLAGDEAWAYIVETSGASTGKLVCSSFRVPLLSNGSRVNATASQMPGTAV